jgi:hypothetical protein
MEKQELKRLVEQIYSLHNQEIDCDDCDAQMDCLVELAASGYDCGLMLPAVQAHLDCCSSCSETFLALLGILKAQQAGEV